VIGMTQYEKLSANFENNAGILGSVFSRFSAASLVEKKKAPAVAAIKVVPAVKISSPIVREADKEFPIRPDDRFAVIVGAFRVQQNAEKLIAELQEKGIRASIFDQSKTGLFRVTIGTSSDRADAKQLLASVKSNDFSGAWILAK